MNLPSLNEITEKALKAFKRFPVTLIWVVLGSFYFIGVIDGSSSSFDNHSTIFITLILGVSWLIGIQFFIEQMTVPKKWIWLKLLVLILLFIFYFQLPEPQKIEDNVETLTRFFLYFIGGHLFVFFAPFITKWDKDAYWNYLISVGAAIGRSALFSGVLYLGLVLALVAIDALFDVAIYGKRYGQLFVFCIGIVNTWIYLSDFPKNIQKNTKIHINKALEVFVKYILIPLVVLYIIILYAYSFKILFQWELPKGWVSYLVTALALLGFLVQIIINPIQKTVKSWMINQFHPWFYRFLLPLIALLFVAIYRRISDYGITEKRYFVVVIAIWILGMSLYFLFSKKKRLIVLHSSLLILVLITSFGIWGAFEVSKNSQTHQFEKVFKKVSINNKIASNEQYNQLKSILNYLDDRESISRLDAITAMDMKIAFKDTIQNYGWFDTNKILDSLGITLNSEKKNDVSYYNYYSNQQQVTSYDIATYQYMTEISLPHHTLKNGGIGKYKLNYNSVNLTLELLSQDNGNIKIPIQDKLRILAKYGTDLSKAKEEELTIISKNDSVMVKLIFTDLSFNIKNDSMKINHSKAFLFLKQD